MIGIGVSVPLFSNQEDYVGYVPKHWPSFGDSTPIVGFVLSAVLYLVFSRVAGRTPTSVSASSSASASAQAEA